MWDMWVERNSVRTTLKKVYSLTFWFCVGVITQSMILAEEMPMQKKTNKEVPELDLENQISKNKTFPSASTSVSSADSLQKSFQQEQILAKHDDKKIVVEKSGVKGEEEKKNIYLNFENTSLANFVNYMAEMKKLNLIPDKALNDAKVSLTIREPLDVQGAWNIFLTVLEMAGFSIVKVGDIFKVIPKDQKLTQPLPSYINVPVDTLPDSDLTIRYVFFLQNLSVDSVGDLLESMLSDRHQMIRQSEVNGFIITDKAYNIKSAIRLIQELDRTGQIEAVIVMKLNRTNATDVKELLSSLIQENEGNPLARLLGKGKVGTTKYFPTGTRIFAEERTNSLILMGHPDSIKKIENFIVNQVDTELKSAESPLHIYELQYTDAQQIATVLREVMEAPSNGPGEQAAKFGAIRGGVKYFKKMGIQIDKEGNRLIISSTDKDDWKMLKKTIRDLDKPQPQVAVETLFVSISADNDKELGGMLRNKKHGQIGKNIDFQSPAIGGAPSLQSTDDNPPVPVSLIGNLLNQLVSKQGATLLSFGKAKNIWAVLQAFKKQKNVSIISQPFITVANKTAAVITIGEDIQVLQQEGNGLKGYTTVSANTTVELEPQINLDGIIRMRIDVNIAEFLNPTTGDKEDKKIKTNVTMADGQVLVLGGFIKTKVEETKIKTPLLGDIPIFGWLFKRHSRNISKSYIFIFMSPTIIKPRQRPGMGLYTKMKLHQVTNQIEEGILTAKSRDPIFNWFFDPTKENYSHKTIDFANARYQPTTVDIKNDIYYRADIEEKKQKYLSKDQEDMDVKKNSESEKEKQNTKEEKPVFAKLKHDPDLEKEAQEIYTSKAVETKTSIPTILKQLPVKPILHPLKKEEKYFGSDNELDIQRKKLKETIAKSSFAYKKEVSESLPMTKKEELKKLISVDQVSTEQKKKQLKDLLAKQPIMTSQEPLNLNLERRKSLKTFLSGYPTNRMQSERE
jgi:general secretion pathway protein D